MYSNQSHGRLTGIFVVVGAAVLLSFCSGIWLHQKIYNLQKQGEESRQIKHLSVEAQMLTDMVLQEIDFIRVRAEALADESTRGALATPPRAAVKPTGKMLYWAELTVQGSAIQAVKRSEKNTSWNISPSAEQSYLKSVVQSLDLSRIESQGVDIVRMKQALNENHEWMSLAFLTSQAGHAEKSILLVWIDPAQAFPAFQHWGSHSAGGRFRGYLLGQDGRVLAHSQKTWVTADMSGLPFFKDQIRNTLAGKWVSGSGETIGIDQTPVEVAYFRVGKLPLVAVVEEVLSSTWLGGNWFLLAGWLLCVGLFLGVCVLGCAWFLKVFLVKKVAVPILPEDQTGYFSSSDTQQSQDILAQPDLTVDPLSGKPRKFFSGDEYLILGPSQNDNPPQR